MLTYEEGFQAGMKENEEEKLKAEFVRIDKEK